MCLHKIINYLHYYLQHLPRQNMGVFKIFQSGREASFFPQQFLTFQQDEISHVSAWTSTIAYPTPLKSDSQRVP